LFTAIVESMRGPRGRQISFDPPAGAFYARGVDHDIIGVGTSAVARPRLRLRTPLPEPYTLLSGERLLRLARAVQGVGSFALITLGVCLNQFGRSSRVIRPLVRREIARGGVRLLPMFLFLAAALGLVVIGQTVSWLTRVGAIQYLGTVMVVVVVRELGPLLTAMVVLARVGTANVVELGTARALGEVEALEALGIDPVHYLVVPRVLGMATSMFALTVYMILGALVSGYLWAFLQDVPLLPSEYFRQFAGALGWMDFLLLGLKTTSFGGIIALVTSYHGLAQPLRLEEVSAATVSAVTQSVVACVVLDALFMLSYLVPQ
jgi:phospholipid/cholesterol/gamma-HCH transport system permease protein